MIALKVSVNGQYTEDLTVLNGIINAVGELGEKAVLNKIKESGKRLF